MRDSKFVKPRISKDREKISVFFFYLKSVLM
nr:MAG TPA: Protein of unknown function (DUF2418) [Caudoviricetes sp.]